MKLPWNHVHFTGTGGVGMAGLAHILLDAGCQVSGSDAVDSPYLQSLARHGASVTVGHCTALPSATRLLVYSSAVQSDNPERRAADAAGIPCIRRGNFLAELAQHFDRVIAVSGSHGKTSTSAMLSHILQNCGIDTGYMVGGIVNGREYNGHAGDGNLLVTEVDESDGTQALLSADTAIILNIEDDHSWSLGGQDALEQCFRDFALKAKHVLAWDTSSTRRLLADHPDVRFIGESDIPANLQLPVPGTHNRKNATIALVAAETCGLERAVALKALKDFPGVSRRLSLRLSKNGGNHLLYEDYAHHPTELYASLTALHEAHPTHRLVAIFQPHRSERVRHYHHEFAKILAEQADFTIVLPAFAAWLQDGDESSNPACIVEEANHIRNGAAEYRDFDLEALTDYAKTQLSTGRQTLVAVIGAGDVNRLVGMIADGEKEP